MLMNLIIHLGNRVCRGCTLKGSHGYFVDEGDIILFSVIWAFSEYKFYGLIINQHTNTQYEFYFFSNEIN